MSKFNYEGFKKILRNKQEDLLAYLKNQLTKVYDEKDTIIDDEYLMNTIYIESMEKFNYSPKRVDIS